MSEVQPGVLSEIVALSKTMLCHAEAGEWLALAELECRRRALIEERWSFPPDAAQRDACSDAIKQVLALDRRTMALAQAGHQELARHLHSVAQGRTAVQAYARQTR